MKNLIFSLDKIKQEWYNKDMKKRIVIKEKNQKDKIIEVVQRDYNVVIARNNFPSRVWENKKRYSRKEKYKNTLDN